MSEIPKAYEPQAVEDKWYDFWQKQGCFTADPKSAKPAYSIVIPPPNVTGMLHMGHVLNNTIQDILSRKARMDGKEVLWLPGTDHAGIATQVQVEKQLKKEEKKTRHDLGREEFLKRVWAWKEEKGGIIINQLKKLGCSCDWTRERFTMDPEYSRCVQKVFVELYKKGLIYRGKRMVNWCPVSQTALSDEEVEMKPQRGFMYHFRVEAVEADGSPVKVVATPSSQPKVGATPPSPKPAAETASEGARATSGDEGVAATKISGPEIDAQGRVWLTIATTRPETIPGDTAVAVNPKDPRYAHLIGKHIVRPLPAELPLAQKLIPIVGDEHVDFEFGTGVLKVTPAHDKADFDIGARHKLPLIEVINADGSMNTLAGGPLAGLDRFKARKVAVEILTEQGVMIEAKPYENNVGFSQRADVPIEPRLSEQWFLKYPAVPESKACVEQESDCSGAVSAPNSGEGSAVTDRRYKMRFHPQRWAKVYDHWLTNIQDWCISRQLWWGHRIPVWSGWADSTDVADIEGDEGQEAKEQRAKGFVEYDTQVPAADGTWKESHWTRAEWKSEKQQWFVWHCVQPGFPEVEERLSSVYTQDPDVLDTWFSSWLWPFATMGWPEPTETLKKFYPTTDLVTGPDIIFFWVARMIMAGYEFMGDAKFALPDAMPFQNVYFTGIIRDKQGRKMSKTLGNSPDPLVLIAQYGADALRFGTMRSAPLGQDVLFDEKDVELGRNFCNKLWNACRFRQMVGGQGGGDASSLNRAEGGASTSGDGGVAATKFEIQGEIVRTLLTPDDKWILLKLDAAIREVSIALNEYKFSEATAALYRFFWNEYCDWYVEASKAVFFGADDKQKANTLAVIDFVLSHMLRMFHPFLPFITEELWHGMGYSTDMPEGQGGKTIMNAPWPMPLGDDEKGEWGLDDCYLEVVNTKFELVVQGRNLRRAGNIQAGKKVKYVFKPSQLLTPHDAEVIKLLLNAESLQVDQNYVAPKGTPSVQSPIGELLLPLEGLIDVAAEKTRLAKEVEKDKAEIAKVEAKLANPNFTTKVPAAVLAEHEQRLVEWKAKLSRDQAAWEALG
ncbi:MAG: valine--tRNA ligase [Verrucomicrobiota bacterium]